MTSEPPLIAHIIYRLSIGGLENGLINLVNHMPEELYRHAIICLTEDSDFRNRLKRTDIQIFSLKKTGGKDLLVHRRLYKVLRKLSPDIVHTRNLSALEYSLTAAMAGVPGRVHSEHGRDTVFGVERQQVKYGLLRTFLRPFVSHYITVSTDLERWLVNCMGLNRKRVTRIFNGVDTSEFSPRTGPRIPIGPKGFTSEDSFVVGTVGRADPIKAHGILVQSFMHLLGKEGKIKERLRLVIVGDGPTREESEKLLNDSGSYTLAWLPGDRNDIPEIMRGLDLFVLPSISEGMSNTILEAMASGLPVIATRVGGNSELVENGKTGILVQHGDPIALADAIFGYLKDNGMATFHGRNGRKRAETLFSMKKMVEGYLGVYNRVLTKSTEEQHEIMKTG